MTKDGFASGYVAVRQAFVAAGYVAVAPDLEGLRAVASGPLPYYNAASLARSLLAGVRAARHAEAHLSPRWAAVGHSEGGHGALFAETYAAEAPEPRLRTTVAFAPSTSVAAMVTFLGKQSTRDLDHALDYVVQQNFSVGLLAAGLLVQTRRLTWLPSWSPTCTGCCPPSRPKGRFRLRRR